MVATHARDQSITLTTEAGAWGGIPGGGLRFGTSHNAACLIPGPSMLDFYQGAGVDVACLGMAQVRPHAAGGRPAGGGGHL
jgi:propionate CoA-transferase